MAFTFGNLARIGASTAQSLGLAQANQLGLGQDKDAQNGLAITSLMEQQQEQKGLVGTLMNGGQKKGNDLFQFNKDVLGGIFSTKV